ncbi:hypothetical protein Tco_1310696 [Tanacetum coccineum]
MDKRITVTQVMENHPSQCKQDDNLQQILKCQCRRINQFDRLMSGNSLDKPFGRTNQAKWLWKTKRMKTNCHSKQSTLVSKGLLAAPGEGIVFDDHLLLLLAWKAEYVALLQVVIQSDVDAGHNFKSMASTTTKIPLTEYKLHGMFTKALPEERVPVSRQTNWYEMFDSSRTGGSDKRICLIPHQTSNIVLILK